MPTHPPEQTAYASLGQVVARSPLVIAVPHAGRHYPATMLAVARLPITALETIEDRHADLLVRDAVSAGAVAIVARYARAYIDLNRDEREIDPVLFGTRQAPGSLLATAKVIGGLGVIPSRIAAGGAIWSAPLGPDEIETRMAAAHRPYHAAIKTALDAAYLAHGVAILIDCHSMPALPGPSAPRLVIGDLHGRSADTRFIDAVTNAARREGVRVARNYPYAGGHTLERHGQTGAGRHAVQIEIDRSLYLDATLRHPGKGIAEARRLLAAICLALKEEALSYLLAAE